MSKYDTYSTWKYGHQRQYVWEGYIDVIQESWAYKLS